MSFGISVIDEIQGLDVATDVDVLLYAMVQAGSLVSYILCYAFRCSGIR